MEGIIKYEYITDGKHKVYSEPLKKKNQYGFFGTKKDGSYDEVTWDGGKTIIRSFSEQSLFTWLHNTVPIPCWGDMSIKKIN